MGRSHSHIKKGSTARRIKARDEARQRRDRIKYGALRREAARQHHEAQMAATRRTT